jgi:hypothetical protein
VQCGVKLTLVSVQGALKALESKRRRKSQYSSHALRADRYWLLMPSGVSENHGCSYPDEHEANSMLPIAL